MSGCLRIGTRGSALALQQSQLVANLFRKAHPTLAVEIISISTRGDRVQNRPISELGDKGVFIRAIEQALLDGEVDLAVHSLKDVPSDIQTSGLDLFAFPDRDDPHDALISRSGLGLMALEAGQVVGTSSLRRRVQLLDARPDLQVRDIRGNVDTRLKKLADAEYDAIILAAAGLARLGLTHRITELLHVDQFCPDAGQGIIVVQGTRDGAWRQIAQAIDQPLRRLQAEAERGVVRALQADCHSPVGAYLQPVTPSEGVLRVMAASPDGGVLWRCRERVQLRHAASRGSAIGEYLRASMKPVLYTER